VKERESILNQFGAVLSRMWCARSYKVVGVSTSIRNRQTRSSYCEPAELKRFPGRKAQEHVQAVAKRPLLEIREHGLKRFPGLQ